MMGSFGKFLEVGLPASDVLRSLGFYRALGFTELTTGDVRRWHYAVVSDGHIALGLHGEGIDEPALVFVRPNLARQVRSLQDAGHAFDFVRLGPDEFHEAALRTPAGQLILMIEARTFSPGTEAAVGTLLGRCVEVSLACADADASQAFFEQAGFLPEAGNEDEVVRLASPGLIVGLRPGRSRSNGTLRFRVGDLPQTLQRLSALGIEASHQTDGYAITAPEGTRLLVGQQ